MEAGLGQTIGETLQPVHMICSSILHGARLLCEVEDQGRAYRLLKECLLKED